MTFSIIIKDGSQVGIAVATAVPGGARMVPVVVPYRGALCVQGLPNPFWRPYGTMMLDAGASADAIVRTLVPPDPMKATRQLLVLGNDAQFAGFTGAQCPDFARHLIGDNFAVAGNILASPDVLAQMARIAQVSSLPLATRLQHALELGEQVGGDARGTRSACILIGRSSMTAVDDHPEPVIELARIAPNHATAAIIANVPPTQAVGLF